MSQHQPIGGRVLTIPFVILGAIAAIGAYYLAQRFMYGLGAVTHLNNGYPWGIWVVYDIVIGTAIGCGGYALAFAVYVFNKGRYHPLVRPALLASLLGYTMGGFGAFFDMGRYWQFYNILLPGNMNFNSVMLEVGLCVFTYVLVLMVEFSPAVLEKFGMKDARAKLDRVLFFFIALGVLLPTMHQSSLGSLLIALGHKVTPLWQTMSLQPVLALITALIMGFSIVIFEASLGAVSFRRPLETPLLSGLAKVIVAMLGGYLVLRLGNLAITGKLGLAFAGDLYSTMFLIETALFSVPLVILLVARDNAKMLLWAAVSMLFAGALYRFNAFLIGFDPGEGYTYFPSAPEIMVTLAIVAVEIMVYLWFVKKLPVLHRVEHA